MGRAIAGFRYALQLEDGTPPEQAIFVSALPLELWRPGRVFLNGALERLPIVAIDTEVPGVLAGYADAIWIVEPA